MLSSPTRRRGFVVVAMMGLLAALTLAPASAVGVGPDRLFSSETNPTTAYKAATCVFLVGQIADGQTFSSLSQCGVTATFNHAVEKRSVRAGGTWATWGSPPFTEGNKPGLIANFSSQVTINLSSPQRVVGMELEGNLFQDSLFTVKFRDAANNNVGIVTRQVDGNAGARLFAGRTTSPTPAIKRIVITSADATGFAIAKLRVSAP
jgi:hypothetical protein